MPLENSAFVRTTATGVRSSWEASAMKARWVHRGLDRTEGVDSAYPPTLPGNADPDDREQDRTKLGQGVELRFDAAANLQEHGIAVGVGR